MGLVLFVFLSFISFASDSKEPINVYFGAGCFWHMQHIFIVAEQEILSRDVDSLTSLAGYAGSTETADGVVCYHNAQGIGDYGEMGHAEAIYMTIPTSSFEKFSKVYADQFVHSMRRDPQDQGGEYRSLVGIPDGMNNTDLISILEPILESVGLALTEGKGSEDDTLTEKIVYVMDTSKFPFYQAEMWHQFHDDMVERYPAEFHVLKADFKQDCRVHPTGCPDKETSSCKENHDPITGESSVTEFGTTEPSADTNGGIKSLHVLWIVLGVLPAMLIFGTGVYCMRRNKSLKGSSPSPNYAELAEP